MIEKIPYDPKTHTGVTPVDCKSIHMAIQHGDELFIGESMKIYDIYGTWIADGKVRVVNEQ